MNSEPIIPGFNLCDRGFLTKKGKNREAGWGKDS